ncbi:MAG TPA: hypothetical protein VGF69_10475 [Thermoanaerobaculia bacterium]|jgi:hypothetical protein
MNGRKSLAVLALLFSVVACRSGRNDSNLTPPNSGNQSSTEAPSARATDTVAVQTLETAPAPATVQAEALLSSVPVASVPVTSVPVTSVQPEITSPAQSTVTVTRAALRAEERPVAERVRAHTAHRAHRRPGLAAVTRAQVASTPGVTSQTHPRDLRPVEGDPNAKVTSYEVIRLPQPFTWLLIIALTIGIPIGSSFTPRRPAFAR